MAEKNKKGQEIKEYPKLVRVSDKKKVLVQNKEEEDKVLTAANKPAGKW